LARAIEDAGYRILGTPFDAVDLAEDRERFAGLLRAHGLRSPEWGIAASPDEAVEIAERIGYPVLVRPSYVLGGRAMRVCYSADEVRAAMEGTLGRVLVDRFLESAIEIDVDALSDGTDAYVGAVMQHVEEAGVHSGDSACVLPAGGTAFLSVREQDKPALVPVAAALAGLGFELIATSGTATALAAAGLKVTPVRKVSEGGEGATVVDLIRRSRCDLVVNTPEG